MKNYYNFRLIKVFQRRFKKIVEQGHEDYENSIKDEEQKRVVTDLYKLVKENMSHILKEMSRMRRFAVHNSLLNERGKDK